MGEPDEPIAQTVGGAGENPYQSIKRGRIVLVCGGRTFRNHVKLFETLDNIHRNTPVVKIVHGGAKGADAFGGQWATDNGVLCVVYPAHWDEHGRAAGIIRNQQMLKEERPDVVVAGWGGPGTADMIIRAKRIGIPVVEVEDIGQ